MSTTMRDPAELANATRLIKNYVGGSFVEANPVGTLDVTDPATGATLAQVPLSSKADVDAAVKAAREAFPGWRRTPTIERARRLFTLREALLANRDRLAKLVTIDMGKTLPDATAEVMRAVEMVECACAIPTTMQGRNLENVATNVDCETYRQPIGVFAAICPFNFPMMVPFWFMPFALATGNCLIVKPSEQVPLAQEAVFEIIHELGIFPAGALSMINGGREVVEALLDHPEIDGISFVGSANIAKLVYERSAKAGKRVQALGGAKNHMVVMPDAVIEKTVDGVIGSAFGAAGQRCMAGSVMVTVGAAHDRIMPPLLEAAAKLKVGNGLAEGVGVGPLVSCDRRDAVRGWIDQGEAEGAKVLLDGRTDHGDNEAGAFVGPTILDDVTPSMAVAREEIFGPVLSVVRAESLDEAIEIVNASRYGNGTSIFTESGAAARRYRHDIDAGMIGVNVGVAAPVAFFPFSGWKDSFLGDLHAHGGDAVEFYTRKTTVTSRWFSEGEVGKFFVE